MATRGLIVLWLLLVGVSLPASFPTTSEGGWFPRVQFAPLWIVAIFLAQIIAFRLFRIDISKPVEVRAGNPRTSEEEEHR